MKYFLFLDETGDHGLAKYDPDFPVFLLCGVLVRENEYELISQNFNDLKYSIWGHREIIFHSRDIRKCEKDFRVLFDQDLKKLFYEELNKIVITSNYNIIASAIKKENYIQKYGKHQDDIYTIALSYIIAQTIVALENIQPNADLSIIIERRGKKEDRQLHDHFKKIKQAGSGILSSDAIMKFKLSLNFRNKKENINGLQLTDLVAYPIARSIIDPLRANPAFEVLEGKIFRTNGKIEGLKVYP